MLAKQNICKTGKWRDRVNGIEKQRDIYRERRKGVKMKRDRETKRQKIKRQGREGDRES